MTYETFADDWRDANMKRLTDKIVDERLCNRNIKRLDTYFNNRTKYRWLCEICSHIWFAKVYSIFSGEGCPACAGNAKHTNTSIDDKLIGTHIVRIDDYISNKIPIRFQCNKNNCNNIWQARPNNILNGSGCPKCSGKHKYSNEEIDLIFKNKNIQRLDNYINGQTPTKVKCLINNCGHIWNARFSHIINNNSGCPKCSFQKNEKSIGKILLSNNIEYKYQEKLQNIVGVSSRYIIDYFIPTINCILEYNGLQHYEPVRFLGMSEKDAIEKFEKQSQRDKTLEKMCKEHNIKLIIIDGRKYTNSKLENYIVEAIVPILKGETDDRPNS